LTAAPSVTPETFSFCCFLWPPDPERSDGPHGPFCRSRPSPPRDAAIAANRFFGDDDYELYRDLLASQCRGQGVACWAYCLLPNHVHLILVPDREEALGRALGETHRRYFSVVNARLRVTGHLFQSRFGSVVMDEAHLMAAARYVALNPVRAGLAARAEDWRWSSARAHLEGRDDRLVSVAPLAERCGGQFADLLDAPASAGTLSALRAAETIGRPLGSPGFLDLIAAATGRDPRPRRRGPRPKMEQIGV
jgi:REP-associated tyrosine transposase